MSQAEQEFHFSEFENLDNSNELEYLMKSMDVMSSLPCIQAIKKQAIDKLMLQEGDCVLEAGCGLGDDAEAIGKIIGNSGRVIAVDASQSMINEAIKRSTCSNIDYQIGKIGELEFSDNYFSAAHADRLLVSHANVDEMFADLVRVVEPGGRVSITDVDAMTISFSPHDQLTEKVLNGIHSCFVNPTMGRQLPRLFEKHGLTNIEILPNISSVRDYHSLQSIFRFKPILTSCVAKKIMTCDAANTWVTSMEKAQQNSTFFYCIVLFTVIGVKQ